MAKKKGSISFCEVSLRDLNSRFKEDARILVSLRFLKMNGMVDIANPVRSDYSNIKAAGEQPEVQEVSIQEIKLS